MEGESIRVAVVHSVLGQMRELTINNTLTVSKCVPITTHTHTHVMRARARARSPVP